MRSLNLRKTGFILTLGMGFTLTTLADPSDCWICHDDPEMTMETASGDMVSLHVGPAKYEASVHGILDCVDCHTGLDVDLHPSGEDTGVVNCLECHQDQGANGSYSMHLKARDEDGNEAAAQCWDCHGAHDVMPVFSASSHLHYTNLLETCGACHPHISEEAFASVHGEALMHGVREAPTCTDCHFEHIVGNLDQVEMHRISEEVCTRCHASTLVAARYGIPGDRVKTFQSSYHGLAGKLGSTKAANCASCHGVHNIRPSTDPKSLIHPSHLRETCGQCHPGATDNFIAGKIHAPTPLQAQPEDTGELVNFYIARIYQILIFCTIGFMLVHNGLAWRRKSLQSLRRPDRTIKRMDRNLRLQHGILAFSFIYLAISGFALAYPESWAAWLLGSDEEFRRWSHRIAGVVMMVLGGYHIFWSLGTKKGRKLLRDLAPNLQDFRDLVQNLRWFAKGSKEVKRPTFARFGYAEKMEYWAVVWGTVIMSLTGLAIWFKVLVTQPFPRWVVDACITLHFYEAVLAVLAIIVWHLYHVIFDPEVYPANWAFLDGRVSREWYAHEHGRDRETLDAPEEPKQKTDTPSAE